MSNPYQMFKTKETKTVNTPVALDYGDFKIFIKYGGPGNRSFIDAYNLKMRQFDRRSRLAEMGRLSDDALELLEKQKAKAMAELYADHIIVTWENVRDEENKMLEFNRANVVKILTDLDPLFADIISQSSDHNLFAEQEKETDEKNLPPS